MNPKLVDLPSLFGILVVNAPVAVVLLLVRDLARRFYR